MTSPLWFSKLLTNAPEDKPTPPSLWDPEIGFWHDPTMTPKTFADHFDEMQERSDLHTHEVTLHSGSKFLPMGRRIRIAFPTYVPHIKYTREHGEMNEEDLMEYTDKNMKFFHVGNPHELAELAKRIYPPYTTTTIREIDRSDPLNPVAGKRADLSPKKDPFPDSQLPSAVHEFSQAQQENLVGDHVVELEPEDPKEAARIKRIQNRANIKSRAKKKNDFRFGKWSSDKLIDSVFPNDFKLSKAFPIWVGKATDKKS